MAALKQETSDGKKRLHSEREREHESESEARVKRSNRVDAGERLACRVAPTGDVEVTARYW